MEETVSAPLIVVGVDGSEAADRAVRWSIDEAQLRGAALRIVTAWHVPLAVYAGHGSAQPPTLSLDDALREAAEGFARAAAQRVREAADIEVQTRVVEGHAADVLVEEAREAELLVLGSPHRSGISSGLSSVSVQCALHAVAPTAVVH